MSIIFDLFSPILATLISKGVLKTLTGAETKVLIALLAEGYGAWCEVVVISHREIADRTGLSRCSVMHAVNSLEDKGLMRAHATTRNGKAYALLIG